IGVPTGYALGAALWLWQCPARALRALRVSRAALDPRHQVTGNGEESKAALGKEARRAGAKLDRLSCTTNGYTNRDR
ncbi:MAG: hypothetical protein ACP5GA_10350, partial [Acidithiobacillus sp.]